MIDGFKKAYLTKKIKIFVEMDADYSHDQNELKNNLKFFKEGKYDLLISSRYLSNSKIINWPVTRKIFSLMANSLARFLLKVPVSDYTNGFRIYSNNAANHIAFNCGKIGDGFIINQQIKNFKGVLIKKLTEYFLLFNR